MKNLYHYTMAMLHLKIAGLFRDGDQWGKWMDKSMEQIGKVKK